jgi:DNA-binding beta-propeller fold protein YncE
MVVVAVRQRVLRPYDARSLSTGKDVGGGVGPTHIVSDCSQRVYVADTEGHAILAYRVDSGLRFADRINLPSAPYGIAIDCRRRLLWVTEPERNRLREFRIPHYQGAVRFVRSYATVRQPNSVAADSGSGRVVVASRSDDVLQILEPAPLGAGR